MAEDYSKACLTTPVAITGKYEGKGQWVKIGGMKACMSPASICRMGRMSNADLDATGLPNAKKGILFIYDIFGYTPQTIQGADILANESYFVVMPDFFEGKPASLDWHPTDTDEKKAKMQNFFVEVAAPQKTVSKVSSVMSALKSGHPSIASWSVIGYCWGAKIVALTSREGTPFKAAVQTSPALVDPNDASEIVIPMAMLASKEEDP